MEDIWQEIAEDIMGNKSEKRERKRKLNELLDRYHNDVQALEDDAGVDGIEYMFCKTVFGRGVGREKEKCFFKKCKYGKGANCRYS